MQNPSHIQGVSLAALADEFGTPAYIYDGEKITTQVKTLQEAFSTVPLKIKYATKALSNINILKLIRKAGAGIDAVSIEEVKLGMMAGYSPEEIMYTPSGVGFEEIREAVKLGIMINLDSLPLMEEFGQIYGNTVPACIRINPHIMAGGNIKISTGHKESKFGISIEQLPQILKKVSNYKLQIIGLHIHTGSDILDAEVFLRGGNVLFEAAMKFADLKFLDFGGGFKVAYKPNDISTDIMEVGKKVGEAFQEFCLRYGRQLELWLEPGKFLVSEAGYLLVKANVVKESTSVTFVGVDSGLNHLIRPMMYDAYHEVYNLSNPEGKKAKYNVVGYICETDTIAAHRELTEVKAGDLLVIKNAGAYGFSMASNYNSRLRPPEILIWGGKAHQIRKRENFEDLIRNQEILDI
ncbi:diaminopimelate decarboxylase [Algoriphagus boritolerans]|uniref:Diaminopimelate decarboxylase n=1 Tax=Algoriphagus boritolerans DSM 17298 = JCM 18970 TaxID=1120964 RepID=A0A1H5V9W7_9BACT|nr:diaminopimelate decarboxylase [Algoriphagus boritolerans]SEF84129.1 diaminopimelate decarboxylase [Algoriphagus boritolerans DSM 17298 = JCM 18970]